MGLLDFATDPQSSMLTNMGLGLLSAGGPSSRPVSLGQAIGSAGQMGMEGFQQAQQNQMRQMQLGDAQRKQLALKQFREQLPPQMQAMFDVAPEAVLSQIFKEDTPISLGEGAKLVTRSGREIASNPKAAEVKNGYLVPDGQGGWKIDQTLYQAALGKSRAGASNTTVVNAGPKAFEQETGKQNAEQYGAIQKASMEANGKVARLDRIGQLLTGIDTGKITPALTQATALADSLGIKIDPKLPAKQAVQALSNEIALQLRNPSGGAGMPGAMSDSDRQFLTTMTPSLGNTPEGNKLLIETAKKLAKRDQEVAKMAREYRLKHGTFDEGFYQELSSYANSNPLFTNTASVSAPPPGAVRRIR